MTTTPKNKRPSRKRTTVGRLAWHVHHSDILCEALFEPIERRRAYIKANKPKRERAIRLRLLRLVRGPLPSVFIKAAAAYARARINDDKAWSSPSHITLWAKRHKTQRILDVARAVYSNAREDCLELTEALHAKECKNCPWDGRTIFPKSVKP